MTIQNTKNVVVAAVDDRGRYEFRADIGFRKVFFAYFSAATAAEYVLSVLGFGIWRG